MTEEAGTPVARMTLAGTRIWPPAAIFIGLFAGWIAGALMLYKLARPGPATWMLEWAAGIGTIGAVASLGVGLAKRGRPAEIEIRPEGLRTPGMAGGLREIPLDRVLAWEHLQLPFSGRTIVAVRNALPVVVTDRQWSDDDRGRFLRALEETCLEARTDSDREALERRNRTARAWGGRLPLATLGAGLVILCIWSVQAITPDALTLAAGAKSSMEGVRDLHRALSPALFHVSWWHLLLNLFGLLMLGMLVERGLGPWRILVILGVAVATGNLASMAWRTSGLTLGASTAVCGLLGALAWLNVGRRGDLPASLLIGLPMAVFFGAPALQWELASQRIDSVAHLGGLIGGAFASWLAVGRSPLWTLPSRTPTATRMVAVATLLAFLAAAVRTVHVAALG